MILATISVSDCVFELSVCFLLLGITWEATTAELCVKSMSKVAKQDDIFWAITPLISFSSFPRINWYAIPTSPITPH